MSFEKLRVYQAAERLDAIVLRLIRKISRGHAKDIDQLKRACASILYNIAEAYGSESPGRKAAFLEIARGSSDEVRAVLRRLVRADAITSQDIYSAAQLSVVICKMLTSWIQALEHDGGDPQAEL
jgi:four helix bundle protein